MPRKGGRRKSQRGKGIGGDILRGLRKANDWARKTKAISKVATTLASVGVPYAGNVANVAGQLGYGYGASTGHQVIPHMMKAR